VSPERARQLLAEDRALKPWPLLAELKSVAPFQCWWDNPNCTEMARGFVGNDRFATHNERVIPRTNRNVTRKWYRSGGGK